ncbi:hypothetical protein ACFPU0_04720 [Pseudomonas sp. GCM10022186]|uniref:hypothetical protein n=1 Tax=Pseudomonas sp. GCM10022186 TaxID=3252650 RepID=UPI0036142D37
MRFETLEIIANGATGWCSGKLVFGQVITQLYATNESGKTPLIMSVLFCLGMDAKFRADIVKNCKSACLTVTIEDRQISFERIIGERFDITVRENTKTINRFYNDEDFSRYLFRLLDIRTDRLITSNGLPTAPYFSTLIPLFYLDQDHGYSEFYSPRQSFIKDQYSEMVRLVNDLPPQNLYDKKRKGIDLQKEVNYLDSTIVSSRKLLERLQQDLPIPVRKVEAVEQQLERAKSRLESLKNTKNLKSEAISGLDELISVQKHQYRELSNEEIKLESKIRSSRLIREEIESEIETLNLNEEARRAFISFSELCKTPNCGMFMASAESYGKSLLYLKDQIKDLEIATAANMQAAEQVLIFKTILKKQIEELTNKRVLAERESGVDAFIEAISATTTEIFELQLEKGKLKKLEDQSSQHAGLLEKRERALSLLESTQKSTEQPVDVLNFRIKLSETMTKWLGVLHARNIPRQIKIDSGLKPIMGEEKLELFKGSSKSRTVLAYHAALFEICVSDPKSPYRALILDTPKQQDIPDEHLDAFVKELKSLAAKNNAQVIFSTSSYRYEIEGRYDREWLPSFGEDADPMYLGHPQLKA